MRKALVSVASATVVGLFAFADDIVISGETKRVAAESELGAAANVRLENGGVVEFSKSLELTKTYSVSGFGGVSVDSGFVVSGKVERLMKNTVGHTFVKKGPGRLLTYSGAVGEVATPTRWIIEGGQYQTGYGGSQFGNHSKSTTNLVLDVREGASLLLSSALDGKSGHSPIGPLELTGGQLLSQPFELNSREGNTAFKGGVVAHACATPSYILCPRWAHLNHVNGDTTFDVETGAKLIMDGILTNGANSAWNADVPGVFTKRGGGELVLLKRGGWTGGTILEGGKVTIADDEALGTSTLTVKADMEIVVLPGVTAKCPPLAVEGEHTLTVTGDGAFLAPASVPEGLTLDNRATGTRVSTFDPETGTLYLNGNKAALDVASGTVTVKSVVEAVSGFGAYTEFVKTGAGTLVMPANSAVKCGQLVISEGWVEAASEAALGATEVIVKGGGLRFTKSFDQSAVSVAYQGTGYLDLPSGITWGIKQTLFHCPNATVVKSGAGILKMATTFRTDSGANPKADAANARWVIHEGTLKLSSGDAFCGYGGGATITLEVHEGAVIDIYDGNAHTPVCDVVLRGGTLRAPYAQYSKENTQSDVGGALWRGWGLVGTVSAQPSSDGTPSRIIARASHAGHQSKVPTFAVAEGATLEIDSVLEPGRSNPVANPVDGGFVKTGAGTLRLLKHVGVKGLVDIRAGTVELGEGVRFDPRANLQVAPTAKLVLNDRALVATAMDTTSALCASADVWIDATAESSSDGATLNTIPNRGTCGGNFAKFTWTTTTTKTVGGKSVAGRVPDAPKYVANGINGKPAFDFNGVQALALTTYTNKTDNLQVFYVGMWTTFKSNGGLGKWGGPLSFGNRKMTQDDNKESGVLSYQHGDSTVNKLTTYTRNTGAAVTITDLAVNKAYLVDSIMTSTKVGSSIYLADNVKLYGATNTFTTAANANVEFVCLGGRTTKDGGAQVWSSAASDGGVDRMYVGRIGEMLAFTRKLTAAEEKAVMTYLKRKWFNSSAALDEDGQKALAAFVDVSVAEDASASFVSSVEAGEGVPFALRKTGEGSLRYGGTPTGATLIDVQEGGLELKSGALASFVDVWVDADDASTYVCNAIGQVTNLVNKGAAGGSFVLNERLSGSAKTPHGPTVAANSINGRPTLTFDGAAALALDSYVNRTSPRDISIYLVARRNSWRYNDKSTNDGGYGKWAGAFSLARTTLADSEEQQKGVCFMSEDSATTTLLDFGSNGTANSKLVPPTGTAGLMVFHCASNGYFLAFETNGTNVAKVPREYNVGMNCEPFDIDLVQLGGRLMKNGAPQWYGADQEKNRMWYGDIAEMIVTTRPLTEHLDAELLGYLRKKWFGTGTGSATPPTWLAGLPAAPVLNQDVALAMADGTSLRHEAASVTLGALETQGTVDWTRVWSGEKADFPMFEADAVSLGTVRLMPVPAVRKESVKIFGYGEKDAAPAWQVFRPDGRLRPYATVTDTGDAFWLLDQIGSLLMLR